MTETEYKLALMIKERISKIVKILDIKVFGSRAIGTSDNYSDMDIFIEVEFLNSEIKDKIREIIWEISVEYSIYISPLILTKDEVTNSPLRASPILENIEKEGIKIWMK